jgi:hypothetical protein
MAAIGGIVFGIIVGYLAWYAIRPGEPGATVNIKTVATFIGVVGGAAITALFKPDTTLFSGYCFGLGLGFFFTPIQRYIFTFTGTHKNRQKEELIKKEKNDIDAKWPSIENYIQTKISNRLFEEYGLFANLMKEIDYTLESRVYILKRYAKEHIDEGYIIDDSYTKWGDLATSHGIQATCLQKDPFFIPRKQKIRKNAIND